MCIIGDFPTRVTDPATPLLNQWYSDFQKIPCETTDTAEDKVAKIHAARDKGQIVIACGNDPATDGPMLSAADHGVMIGNSYRTYPKLTPDEFFEIVLSLSYAKTFTE